MNMKAATTREQHGRNIWFQAAVVSIFFIIDGVAVTDRVNLVPRKMRLMKPMKKHKGTIKTIQTEDGDIIDCVDIYKQPAFDHPALANHTIQMEPREHTEESTTASNASSPSSSTASSAQLKQLNVGDCPPGTIPILRTKNNDDKVIENYSNTYWYTEDVVYAYRGHGHFYGASAYLNVWDLKEVGPEQLSNGYVLVSTKSSTNDDNYMSAEWVVHQPLYGDQKTRFTIDWWAGGPQNTGCYNLNCPGFVQTNQRLYLGAPFERTSTFGGYQAVFKVTIFMDPQTKTWWVKYFNTLVGYWPAALFDKFDEAELINWGGEVGLTSYSKGCPMGNGHYPSEGLFRVSAYISGALALGYDKEYEPHGGGFHFSDEKCYNSTGVGMGKFGRPGFSFYYGGNGQPAGCYPKHK